MVHAKKIGIKLTLRDNTVKDSPLLGRQDFLISRIAKKVLVITTVDRVISKIPGVKKGNDRSAVLVGVQEEKVFKLRLKELDFGPDKVTKVGHT
jgi:hypothetical protein